MNTEAIDKIQFSLKYFLSSESINDITIGSSMKEVLNKFGHPIAYANKDIYAVELLDAVVWGYGQFYLEFSNKKVSKLAFSSYHTIPLRPKIECVDFSRFFDADINECIDFLEKNKIFYKKTQNTMFSKRRKTEIPAPGFSLVFSNKFYIRIKYGSENELVGMSCSNIYPEDIY